MEDLGGANRIVGGDLRAMYLRLTRARVVQNFSSQEEGERRLLQAIGNRPTSVARSEHFAGADELEHLENDRINPIHRFVLETGRKGEKPGRLYREDDHEFAASADRNSGPSAEDKAREKEKLCVYVVGPSYGRIMGFDFRGNFYLEVEFPDPNDEKRVLRYDSSTIPLSKMTDEEFRIIKYYLDEYFSKVVLPSKVRV